MEPHSKTRRIFGWVLALALAAVFGVAGAWKLYDPAAAARQQVVLGLPAAWATPFVVLLGSLELLAAALVLAPPLRRSGAALAAGLTIVFLLYLGVNYSRVKGKECGCLPGRTRNVGAMFFLEDGLLLAAAAASALLSGRTVWTARRVAGLGAAFVMLAGAGWASSRLDKPLFAGSPPLALQMMDRSGRLHQRTFSSGERYLLYFENPTCGSCLLASEALRKLPLKLPLIALPTEQLESSYRELDEVGLRDAEVSTDFEPLSRRLGVERIPSMFLMDGSMPRAVVVDFQEPELSRRLRELGIIR